MDETHQLVEALKRCVKTRGLTYRALADRINLSEASVKRIFAQRSFTVRRLEQVCKAMDMSVTELIRMIDRRASAVTMLSMEQESELARDPALLSYFYLLVNGWTDAQILRGYEFDEAQIAQLRTRLVELELIELLPRRRIRLRVSRRLVWRPDGPVRRAPERQVQTEFLRGGFSGRGEFLGWQPAELTESSIGVLKRKLEHLYDEFLQMAELDTLSTHPRHSTAMLVAFRPWVFSRRRPPATTIPRYCDPRQRIASLPVNKQHCAAILSSRFPSIREINHVALRCLRLSVPLLLVILTAATDSTIGPRYTAQGALIAPSDYREWVFLSAGALAR